MSASALVSQLLAQKAEGRKAGLAQLDEVAKTARINHLGREFLSKYEYTPESLAKFSKDYRLTPADMQTFAETMRKFEEYKSQRLGNQGAEQQIAQGGEKFANEKQSWLTPEQENVKKEQSLRALKLGADKTEQDISQSGDEFAYEKGGRMTPEQQALSNQADLDNKAADIASRQAAVRSNDASVRSSDAYAEYLRSGAKDNLTQAELEQQELQRTRKISAVTSAINEAIGKYGTVSTDIDGMTTGIIPADKVQAAKQIANQNGFELRLKESNRIPGMPGRNKVGYEVVGIFEKAPAAPSTEIPELEMVPSHGNGAKPKNQTWRNYVPTSM